MSTVEHTDSVEQEVDRMLSEISVQTKEIRDLQDRIRAHGIERRKVILRLRDHGVTYRGIAETMGVSEQNVYKILNRSDW